MKVHGNLSYGPQRPSSVPVVEGLSLGRSYDFFHGAPTVEGTRYEPEGVDSLSIHNGPGCFNYLITAGVWYLRAGDRPIVQIEVQPDSGGYAKPAILPDLGVGGRARIFLSNGDNGKWLDRFESVRAILSPGSARWICSDTQLGMELELQTHQFTEPYGFSMTAKTTSKNDAELTWVFGGIDETGERPDSVDLADDHAVLANPVHPFTRVYVGCENDGPRPMLGDRNLLGGARDRSGYVSGGPYCLEESFPDTHPTPSPAGGNPCVLLRRKVPANTTQGETFICVWGYTGHNREGLEEAYNRMKYLPFADPDWAAEMKGKWYHSWIGRGLDPERRYRQVVTDFEKHRDSGVRFWDMQRKKLRISTPDKRFDCVVNQAAASMRMHFEYPGFLHGRGYTKIGKISCGYYGYDDGGLHDEVTESLKLLTGTQDIKGRMRYLEPAFAISSWSEEQDFYFVEQVWYHYRWTGDREFVKVMWPSVRRALEHAIASCDPDGDGIMTAYYEQWLCDAQSRGGKSVLFTALALSALRGAVEMAKIAGQYDTQTWLDEDNPLARFQKLLAKTEAQYDSPFWNKEIGAWTSAEWNGNRHARPQAMEQNYTVRRGWGKDEPMKQYMAMRYLRDNLHFSPSPGVHLELMNDCWPIVWNHHWISNGDTAVSVLAACKAGDTDGYWPSLKTIAETAYTSDTGGMCEEILNDGRGYGLRHSVELEPQVVHAVVSGLFGVSPYFGDNLLVLRPSFPCDWNHARIETDEYRYEWRRSGQVIELRASATEQRLIRAELPVNGAIKNVMLNGRETEYRIEEAVNACRVVIESSSERGGEQAFSIETVNTVSIEGSLSVTAGEAAQFVVRNADAITVYDPQDRLEGSKQRRLAGGDIEISLVCSKTGRCTVFLGIECGDARWFHPLDLSVTHRWSIVKRYISCFNEGGPAVASPSIDHAGKRLAAEIRNNGVETLSGRAVVAVAGKEYNEEVRIAADGSHTFHLNLADIWHRLSPGTVEVNIKLDGEYHTETAVSWDIAPASPDSTKHGYLPLDLDKLYTIGIRKAYSLDFRWRNDYTGCGIGIDWRPSLQSDELGYILLNPPIALYAYGSLEEHYYKDWCPWEVPEFDRSIDTGTGIPFRVGKNIDGDGEKRNLMALSCTQPYDQLPSEVSITLEEPALAEKIYLLTADLFKPLKTYYPGAEVIVRYEGGENQITQLIPPYSMSCMLQPVSPQARHVDFGGIGELADGLVPRQTGLSVSDILVDGTRKVRGITFRCVATETLFGVLAVTLLQAGKG